MDPAKQSAKAKQYEVRDSGRGSVPGLILRVYPSGRRVWGLRYTTRSGLRRWYAIGDFPGISKPEARKTARALGARVDEGADPAQQRDDDRTCGTVADLLHLAMVDHWEVHCKATTVRGVRTAIDGVLVPALGRVRLGDLTHARVSAWHRKCGRETPIGANRCLAYLRKACSLAVEWGMLHANPCANVKRFREKPRKRYLSRPEYSRLLVELHTDRGEDPWAIGAILILLYTGWRRGEVVRIRWEDVDDVGGQVHFADTKAGEERWAKLSREAADILARIPRMPNSPWVFPGRFYGTLSRKPHMHLHPDSVNSTWDRVRKRAGIPDVRLHDLRHSYASLGVARGLSLTQIGKLLGHKSPLTTSRYAHLADEAEAEAAAVVGGVLGEIESARPRGDGSRQRGATRPPKGAR